MATGKPCSFTGSSRMAGGFPRQVVVPRNLKLARGTEKPATLTPSAFLKEMTLSTKQRLASTRDMRRPQVTQLLDVSEASRQKFSAPSPKQHSFQPFPSEVVFQSYVPYEVYEVPLILRNEDKVPQLLKVTLERSPYFKLISHHAVCRKVPPGMLATFHIVFTPSENKDYFHELICITEREKFVVPIRAIGARAILDFPDQVNFSACPVKYSTQKTLLVRNVGNRVARYCISTQRHLVLLATRDQERHNPGGVLAGDSGRAVTEVGPPQSHLNDSDAEFPVTRVGSQPKGHLGEDTHTSLHGAAEDVNIRLDRNSLAVGKTYITLSNHRCVVIHNRSKIIAHFQWKAFLTQEEEDQEKLRRWRRLQKQEENERNSFLKQRAVDPTLQERLALLSRAFQNQRAKVQEDSMLFSDDIFAIEPVEGDVWPNSSIEVKVIFKPREARVYQQTVYCDISGRETRLPLRIKGSGIGPQLRFSFDQLDIGKVFVGSAQSYEAILFNKGVIDAPFSLVPPATALGSCFSFHPQEGIISPDGLQILRISFSSTILGPFTEEFRFSVGGSPEPVTLTVRGCVIGPTLHFNVPSLHFGDVSFGFPHTLSCRLTNTSLVPVTFNLRIPGDGSGQRSVTSFAQISDNACLSWRKGAQHHVKPMEFTIMPCKGIIRSQGALDIQVTLCSNTVRRYELALVLDVDGVGQEVLALPLTARCVVPPLHVLSPVLRFGRCFLKFPYERTLTLVNNSDLPGCYAVLPQEHKEDAAVWYSSPVPCGIIQPHSSVEIPFTLEAQAIGRQDTTASVSVFGNESFPLNVSLVSVGEGPVVYVHPREINFGSIEVLQDASKSLHLSNQAVIPASFCVEMAGKRSRWRIEPSKGVIPPESEVSVAIIANLDDTERFEDEVKVSIENSHTYVIPVQAVGTGTTIVTDKPIAPELNLGLHFSFDRCCYRFKVTNRGRRTHQLCWSTEGFPMFSHRDRLRAISNTKGTDSFQSPKPACPVFKLQPLRTELMPGKTVEMVLEGSSSTPQVVKERLLCHAVVGSKAGKAQIMQMDVTCEFVDPVLQVSTREIAFRVEKLPSDVLSLQHKPLSLKNMSSLPLSVVLALDQPFRVCDAAQQPLPADVQPMKLEVGEERHFSIGFNPAHEEHLNSWVAEKALKIQLLEHPREEQVTVRGEVFFPNLQFQTMAVDFGCILNDTEVERYIEMTNCSPLLVRYHWSFLTGGHASQLRFSPPAPKPFIKPQPPKEEGACSEHSASAESSVTDGCVEEPAEALGAVGDPAQEPADAEDSLEAKLLPSAAVELESRRPVRTQERMRFVEVEPLPSGPEEVFDVLPLYGVLPPGKSQRVTFTFVGRTNIAARVTALCSVEGGPTYEIALSGEASLINYFLDVTEIDCGLQLFNKVKEAEVTLQNRGKVGFTYVVLGSSAAAADSPPLGVPLAVPSTGYIGPGKEQVLKVCYLPGVPGVFCRALQIQVGHLEPASITLRGEGTLPRICLDLPRNISGNAKYEKVLKEAKEKMAKDSQRAEAVALGEAAAAEPPRDDADTAWDTQLQLQVEQLLIEEHALEQQKALSSGPPEEAAFDQRARRRLLKVQLPEYILDFGCVIPGTVRTHLVKITNPGRLPVSFLADRRALCGTGFSVDLDHVKCLPCCKTKTFRVRFDPQSANLPLGEVDVLLPIKVAGGPTFHVRLRADVTVPSLCLSRDRLEFSAVQCGQCREETVQLHNQLQVPCQWFVTVHEPVKVDKCLSASMRRKLLQELEAKPRVFEALPSAGTLAPGQRCNMRVRFSPVEEVRLAGVTPR
ncbi:hydrocephalus-inducing protein homolog, partial [Falco naumanni]|uniref:hydrocephalus-inducing protein homolog n=1 Tax=Falco naumanni TaxID=148594 RepID=UPI001ADE03F6